MAVADLPARVVSINPTLTVRVVGDAPDSTTPARNRSGLALTVGAAVRVQWAGQGALPDVVGPL